MSRLVTWLCCLVCAAFVSGLPRAALAQQAGTCTESAERFAAMESPFVFRTTGGARILLTGLHLTTDAVREHPDALEKVRQRLAILLADGPLTLAYSATTPDKTGACQAQVTNSKGTWIQEQVLLEGLAVFTNKPVSDLYMPTLLLAEQKARQGGIGLWQYKNLLVRTPRSISKPEYNNTYQIVEGPIQFVRDMNRVVMICLDDDPWQSVCLIALRKTYLDMQAAGMDLLHPKMSGTVIRARGEVNYREDAGLKMFIDKLELIQIVSPTTTTPAAPSAGTGTATASTAAPRQAGTTPR